jgi:hypothetical protein
MSEVVCALGGREGGQQVADGVPQGIDGAGGGFTQQRLEFGEELFWSYPVSVDGTGLRYIVSCR